MISEKDLIDNLKNVYEELGRIPTDALLRKYGKYPAFTYARRYGTWNKALEYIIGQINIKSPIKCEPHPCLHCGKITKNKLFCSKSCSAIVNNKTAKKRQKKIWLCQYCRGKVSKNKNVCKLCYCKNKVLKSKSKTIGLFKNREPRHRYQNVRHHAHQIANLHNLPKRCIKCGYDIHVELCHVIDICKFPNTATLGKVNSINNLVYLCRNHHWELGNGLFSIEELNMLKSCTPEYNSEI